MFHNRLVVVVHEKILVVVHVNILVVVDENERWIIAGSHFERAAAVSQLWNPHLSIKKSPATNFSTFLANLSNFIQFISNTLSQISA